MENKKLIICVGISGAGKSTYTLQKIKEDNSYVRINRDSIRLSLFGSLDGYYQRRDLKVCEDMVTDMENCIFELCSFANRNIIIDNTNLKISYIERWLELAKEFNYEVEYKFFDIPLPTARLRVLDREFGQGEWEGDLEKSNYAEYLFKQFEQYKQIKQQYDK